MIRRTINSIKKAIRKVEEEMAIIYANLILKDKKTFADVPARLKDKVKQVLFDLEVPELAE